MNPKNSYKRIIINDFTFTLLILFDLSPFPSLPHEALCYYLVALLESIKFLEGMRIGYYKLLFTFYYFVLLSFMI